MAETTVTASDDKTLLSRMRAQKRRDVTRAVRDVRERLTSQTGTRASFDYELTLAHARSGLNSILLLPALAVLAALIASLWVEKGFVISWLSLVLAASAFKLSLFRSLIGKHQKDVRLKSWRRRFVAVALVQGLCWGAFFFLPSRDGNAFVTFQFAALLIVIAVVTMLASNMPMAIWAGTVPITACSMLAHMASNVPVHYVMAVTSAGAQIFFLMLGYRLYSTALAALSFQAEKDALIAELEQAKGISDESRRRAEEANLAKSRFLATMSHELRTPLNAILGFSEVIKNELLGPLENATYKDYANDIHSSGEHLLNLINEILDLSRIEAGRQELQEEAATLLYIVEDCQHLVALKAKNKDIRIFNQFEQNMPKLWADERAVRQVILNILSNAVKFTPPGGEITIKAGWTAGGGQYVSVRDTGPGIPEEEIPIVLSSFGQGSIAIKSAEQGTGLGLPICQALMKMHGGTFDLRSKLREGTEVIVTFPQSRVLEVMPAIEERKAAQRKRANMR
ncbi:sensor histidine kinase [Rhodobium gokarnense]|uniref:histidine kinase n=1 Tax=Rhodobium gokarnense TaxID=364296 RepID=A0ABT3HB61_9HYPH|nr:HAMP domain-containing sensor histidine kinase [Rhodobium gokarnense]MCW2307626.1 two-component system cell cycle sensor histidine kinase PleC [Rhodobium gokarnense]